MADPATGHGATGHGAVALAAAKPGGLANPANPANAADPAEAADPATPARPAVPALPAARGKPGMPAVGARHAVAVQDRSAFAEPAYRGSGSDFDFMHDMQQAMVNDRQGGAFLLLLLMIGLLICTAVWANFSRLEEITKGDARIIASKSSRKRMSPGTRTRGRFDNAGCVGTAAMRLNA